MRRTPLRENPCSIAKALVRDALLGVTRFEDFTSRLGIPRATLASRLEHLCDRGVLRRELYQQTPPRSEYTLTDRGEALRPIVLLMMRWGDEWLRDDEPPTHLEEITTGRRIEPIVVDRDTGTALTDLQIRTIGNVTDGIVARSSRT